MKLKLGTRKELIKAHLRTNFGWNLIKIYGVMIDFSPKKVEGLSCLQGKPCRWFERNPEKEHRDMTQNPTGVKITRSNCE